MRSVSRWVVAFGALGGIVLVFHRSAPVSPTTVALTLLLFVLILAARWPLRFSVAASLAATVCYNFFFLPPVGTFTIADPQNWLALFAFLATSLIGSRLAQAARDRAEAARDRQREMEALFRLSRELLQTGSVAELVNTLPELFRRVSPEGSAALYLLRGDRLYPAGAGDTPAPAELERLALGAAEPEIGAAFEVRIPLRAGARPRGLLLLSGFRLSTESFQAIGGLLSIALDRAQALEDVARREALEESERLRSLILDSITHELRTPLTSIKGAASTLLSAEDVSPEDRRELLTIVDEEADRLNRLITEAVEMARIEAREIHMHFAAVAVAELVEQARANSPWVSNTHRVSVRLPALPKVRADAEMIAKVLSNLIENAAKYAPAASPIAISAEHGDGWVLLSVADRGIGVDAAEQGLIFERLYRSRRQNGSTPGTGMGLAISRAIVEAHGGRLEVTSRPGHGSTFTFSLAAAP